VAASSSMLRAKRLHWQWPRLACTECSLKVARDTLNLQ
jgi:hypothetical protein